MPEPTSRDRSVFTMMMAEFLLSPALSGSSIKREDLIGALKEFSDTTEWLDSQEVQFPEPYDTDYRE